VKEGEDLIGHETGEADEDDDGKNLVEIPEAFLRFDHLGEAAFHADEFRDDQPCPRPVAPVTRASPLVMVTASTFPATYASMDST
jgi:hypothetical protein